MKVFHLLSINAALKDIPKNSASKHLLPISELPLVDVPMVCWECVTQDSVANVYVDSNDALCAVVFCDVFASYAFYEICAYDVFCAVVFYDDVFFDDDAFYVSLGASFDAHRLFGI